MKCMHCNGEGYAPLEIDIRFFTSRVHAAPCHHCDEGVARCWRCGDPAGVQTDYGDACEACATEIAREEVAAA